MRRAAYTAVGAMGGFSIGVFIADRPNQLLLPFVTAALGAILTWAVRRYAR